jgi:hypothetical protein
MILCYILYMTIRLRARHPSVRLQGSQSAVYISLCSSSVMMDALRLCIYIYIYIYINSIIVYDISVFGERSQF